MDEALKMGKDSAKGSFQLFVARIVSTLILAVTAISVGILIEEADYGLYVIALVPIATFLLFQDWGMGAALTKYCAFHRANKDETNLRKTIIAGLTFGSAIGLALTLLSLLMAGFVASVVLGNSEVSFLVALGSISIFFTGINMASQAIFVGFERMDFTAISLVSQAIVYCALSPLLVFLGYGALGPMLGYTFSYMIAGIVSVVLLYSFIFRKLKPHGIPNFEVFATLKVLFRYGIPLAIANLFSGLFIQFSSFMMAHYSDVVLVGHYKIALNFAVLITFFTGPIATVLFPAFSKIDLGNKQELLRSVYSSSVKYTTLFSFPVTVAMIVLSAPMVSTLYGDKWFYSPFFLSLYVVQYLFVALGAITNNMLLQGLGETKMLMKLTLLTLSFGLPLGFLLIPPFEIVGLIITSLLATLPSLFVGMYWIWRRYRIRVDFNSSVRLCLASAIAGLLTYIFLNTFPTAAWIKLISGATLFLFIYLISAPVIGAINQTDINNLRAMFSGLGIVSKLLEIPFVLIEKSLKISKNLSLVSEQK